MSIEFNLPGSSFEEIKKIIKGYSHAPEHVSMESLSKLTGLHSTQISRNSKFLTNLGIISGGMKKSATELGRKIGRALDHKQLEDSKRYWKQAVQSNEPMSSLVTTVRIKDGMSEKDFSAHVLYVSGQSNNSANRAGARCVVDLLLEAGLVSEEDGKLVVASPAIYPDAPDMIDAASSPAKDEPLPPEQNARFVIPPIPQASGQTVLNLTPQIAINIQLHLPETDNAEVYEKLFKALRENLLTPIE